jgi:flagellar biosynthetic protein FliP
LLTVLSLAPAILILMTSFTRIIVVFSFLRHALGTQQMPPNQVLVGLALFLTVFVMTPAWQKVNSDALQPYLASEIPQEEALEKAVKPLRRFMLKQTREQDLALFVKTAKLQRPRKPEEVSTLVLLPAFVISELKTAFQIGFLIYIPFLVIDMVVASVLLSMGMMMLPPIMISLPFKLLLFVLVDGWALLVGSMLKSFV